MIPAFSTPFNNISEKGMSGLFHVISIIPITYYLNILMKRSIVIICLFIFPLPGMLAQTIDFREPVKYIGGDNTSNSDYLTGFHDGQMKPAVGVQNYQIMRANRSFPGEADGLGWTYNHAPNLAYWKGRRTHRPRGHNDNQLT